MNVLECSLRLGKLLRKTKEGKNLICLQNSISEKYKENGDYSEYERFVEKNSSRYYFYSWDMSYKTFINVLTDYTIEHRELFIPTAKLISEDKEIADLAKTAIKFGNIFEQLVAIIISGGDFEDVVPTSWKFKIKNAISDVQIAVERTMLIKTIALFYNSNDGLLNSEATKKYLTLRENENLLPFSKKAFEIIEGATDVTNEEKILFEKMYLITEAVKKGIFYGFWDMINEISMDEIILGQELANAPLKEITFSHKNKYSSFLGRGWLYKIQLEEKYIYFMAHKKSVHFGQENNETIVSGIIYPDEDRMLFEKDE